MLTLCTIKFKIQKFLEIYEVVELNLHLFITTILDSVSRCGSGEDVVAWPPQTTQPLSDRKVDGCHTLPGHRKWMAAIPCPDTEMNKPTRLMQYEYNINILYIGYLIKNLVKFT